MTAATGIAAVPGGPGPTDRPIRLGLIGCGNFSRAHVHRIEGIANATVTAVADPSTANIDRLVDGFPSVAGAKRYPGHRELLAGDVDGVVIVTPHGLHYGQVADALRAGKHVLCEKPLVTRPAQARELTRLAADAGRLLMVGYQQALVGTHRYAHHQVRSGALGEIVACSLTVSQNWALRPGSWRLGELGEGGFLADTGNHFIDLVLHLTGLRPETVVALSDRDGGGVDAVTGCVIGFAGGRIGTLAFVGRGPAQWRISLVGSEAVIELHNHDGLRRIAAANYPGWVDRPRVDTAPAPEDLPATTTPDAEFVDAIAAADLSRSQGERAVRVAEVMQAVYTSAARGGAPTAIGTENGIETGIETGTAN